MSLIESEEEGEGGILRSHFISSHLGCGRDFIPRLSVRAAKRRAKSGPLASSSMHRKAAAVFSLAKIRPKGGGKTKGGMQ